ncbi:methylated-DNA--[protein]-cysteine S-methyltransferase [Lysobacter korlensis]|uniref:Methylated-DNA--protein-cysteine methyltransferase n=1 Tax=Lysobacter korlensis TaxID=553636 RepID=A0ABV6RK17_9GAMM
MTCSAVLDSQIGSLRLVASKDGLDAIHFPTAQRAASVPGSDPIAADSGRASGDAYACCSDAPDSSGCRACEVLHTACTQLREYFAGTRRVFELPLTPKGTAFQRMVWQALAEIPFGQTASYAQLAMRLGRPTASRAVGAANGRNPLPIVVPCHRVIGADGSLTGFAGGLDTKRFLLTHEGAWPKADLFAA